MRQTPKACVGQFEAREKAVRGPGEATTHKITLVLLQYNYVSMLVNV